MLFGMREKMMYGWCVCRERFVRRGPTHLNCSLSLVWIGLMSVGRVDTLGNKKNIWIKYTYPFPPQSLLD